MDSLLDYCIVALIINLVMFVPAFLFKTDRLTDISYAVTFVALGVFAYIGSSRDAAHSIVLGMVCVWAFRLGGFLLYRVWRKKKDVRFDGMRENFWLFLRFWVLQGLSVFVIMLSSLVLWQQEELMLDVISLGGIYIFTIGLMTETVADLQKYRFNNQPKNKGKWIDTGLWKYSRHPNYLGEILVWVGIWLFVLPYVDGLNMYIVALSPLYIAGLLIFGSGIPILEKSADKRWGKDKKYQEYKKKTAVLVPFVK